MTSTTPGHFLSDTATVVSSPPAKRPPSLSDDDDADDEELLRYSLWGWKAKSNVSTVRRALSERDPNSGWTDEGRGWSEPPPLPRKELPKRDLLSTLPTEILGNIIYHVPAPSLPAVRLVCRQFNQLSDRNRAWRTAYLQQPGWSIRPLAVADWRQVFLQREALEARWDAGQPSSSHILSGHDDSVYCSTIVRDKLITGGRDRKIKFWHIGYDRPQSLDPYMEIEEAHERSVLCLKVDLDESLMVTGSSDAQVRVWQVEKTLQVLPVRLVTLMGHEEGVLDVVLDSRHIISGSKDSSILIWCRHTYQPLRQISTGGMPVNCLDLWPSEGCILAALGNGTVWKIDIDDDGFAEEVRGRAENLAAILRDGDELYYGGIGFDLRQLNMTTGRRQPGMPGHRSLIRSIAGNPQLGRLVTASYDHRVKLWDLRQRCEIPTNFQHGHMVFSVSADATSLVSCSYDRKVHLYKFADGLDYARWLA